MNDPILHVGIEDSLPKGHRLSGDDIGCVYCGDLVHCAHNEFVRPWLETDKGGYCLKCVSGLLNQNTFNEMDFYLTER